MNDYYVNSIKVLEAIILRGKELIEAIENNDWQTFEADVRRRKAALYNYLAIPEPVQTSSVRPDELTRLTQEILDQNDEISKVLSIARQNVEHELKEVVSKRKKFSGYGSRLVVQTSGFEERA